MRNGNRGVSIVKSMISISGSMVVSISVKSISPGIVYVAVMRPASMRLSQYIRCRSSGDNVRNPRSIVIT